MGNLVAMLTHCARGEEIIVGVNAHIFTSEQAGASALGGLVMRQVPNQPTARSRCMTFKRRFALIVCSRRVRA